MLLNITSIIYFSHIQIYSNLLDTAWLKGTAKQTNLSYLIL